MLSKKIVVQHAKNSLEPPGPKRRRKMHKNRPQLLVARPPILHDNARPHIANVVTKKLRDYGWKMLPHAPYSPDMSPTEFELFPKLKEPMRGRRFSSLKELPTDDGMRVIQHTNKSGVLNGIVMLPKCCDSGIEKQGDYIEGL